ncbi:MAG: ribonuclease HI family protein [Patescibacteria group bacterium]
MSKISIYTDGGSRGNPGPAAIGVVVKENNKIIFQLGKTIGVATNNEAEYQGLIEALKWLIEQKNKIDQIDFFLDSKLVVFQMKGEYKVKAPKVIPLFAQAKQLEKQIDSKINYQHIRRELNSQADALLNQALDGLQ